MFPEAMNATNSKKVSELWEEEKKYRWWIIGFAASLIVLFALHLSLVIVAYNFKETLILYFEKFFSENANQNANSYFNGMAMTSIGMSIAFLLCASVFIYSIYVCYKAKSFEKLDSISSFFLGFQTFFSLFSLIQIFMGQDFSIVSGNTIMILYFSLKFMTIPVWLLLSRQIKKIKRSFFIAKRQEEINAFYEANQGMDPNNMNNPFQQQQSPFPFPFQQRRQNPIPQPQPGDAVNNDNTNSNASKIKEVDTKFSKLQLMTIGQLRKIADKLSISGNEDMKKPELIKIILSVSQSLEVEKDDNVKSSDDVVEIKSTDSKEDNIKIKKEPKVKKEPKIKKESKTKKDKE